MRRPHHSTVVAYVALFFAMGGTAAAATGGTFTLGRANTAGSTTKLTYTHGTPLSLAGSKARAPLTVNSGVKVTNLNADRLDGLDSTSLQRRVGGCADGSAIRSVAANGAVTCIGVSTGSTGPSTPAQAESKQWVAADVQISQDSSNNFQAVARLTNNNASTQSASFTITAYSGTTIVGRMIALLNSVPAGQTFTANFSSSDPVTAFDSWTFQTDNTFNG